jgi:hypothetical protein
MVQIEVLVQFRHVEGPWCSFNQVAHVDRKVSHTWDEDLFEVRIAILQQLGKRSKGSELGNVILNAVTVLKEHMSR